MSKEKFPKNRIPVSDEIYRAIEKGRKGIPLYKYAEKLLTSKKFVRALPPQESAAGSTIID